MKIQRVCRECLKGLVHKTIELSGGSPLLLNEAFSVLETCLAARPCPTPPAVANELLAFIRERTGVRDPYATIKYKEYREATHFLKHFMSQNAMTFANLVLLAALGNSTDFFVGGTFDSDTGEIDGSTDTLEEILRSGADDDILFLGDNVGDFVFDMPLVHFLEKTGHRVFYAVKEYPVQNDVSLLDVRHFGLDRFHSRILSTGLACVGLTRRDMTRDIERLWQGRGPVIAKGMGNFETLSEFDAERQVVYIMKVKCPAVASALGSTVGTYIVRVR